VGLEVGVCVGGWCEKGRGIGIAACVYGMEMSLRFARTKGCVAVCWGVLQRVAVCCGTEMSLRFSREKAVALEPHICLEKAFSPEKVFLGMSLRFSRENAAEFGVRALAGQHAAGCVCVCGCCVSVRVKEVTSPHGCLQKVFSLVTVCAHEKLFSPTDSTGRLRVCQIEAPLAPRCGELQSAAVCCDVLRCVLVCCGVLLQC